MGVEPPPAWSADKSELYGGPVWRIVWMGESGVNEELLNTLLTELSAFAIEAQQSRYAVIDSGQNAATIKSENNAEERLRIQINELTRLLVEVLKVKNNEHEEEFNFRLGQCIKHNSLQELRGMIDMLRRDLSSLPYEQHHDLLSAAAGLLQNWRDVVMPVAYLELRSVVIDDARTYNVTISDLLRDQITRSQIENLGKMEKAAASSLEHIDTASGKVGSDSLAKGFASQRDKEARRARWWTGGVLLSTVLGIALPAFVLTTEKVVFAPAIDPTTATIIKALTGVPLFALSAYFGRISSQHRETERYLRMLVTQISAVQAYADVMRQPERGQLIINLGNRAFADPGLHVTDKGRVAVPEDLAELLDKAIEVIKEAGKK